MKTLSAAVVVCALASSALAETIAAVTDDGRLVTFDGDRPGEILNSVAITGLQVGESVVGIDVRPESGQLYGLTGAGRLYVVDANTGAATLHATLTVPLIGVDFGVDFNPTVDRLRILSDAGQSLRVDPDFGTVSVDTSPAYAAGDPNTGDEPRLVDAAYVNDTPGAATTTLFALDSNQNSTTTLPGGAQTTAPVFVRLGGADGAPSPNLGVVTTIGPFLRGGVTLRGFDVSPGGRAYAAATIATAPDVVAELMTVDVATGATTQIGLIGGGGVQVRDIAVLPTIQFAKPTFSTSESAGNLIVAVSRTGGTVGAATVQYATVTGGAVADRDYGTTRGTLSFIDGQQIKTISIPIVDDAAREGDETFQIVLFSPTGGGVSLGAASVATVRIVASDVTDKVGPTMTNVGWTGPSTGITGFVARFDEALDTISAVTFANYAVVATPKKGKKATVALASFAYDPVERVVTAGFLTPVDLETLKGLTLTVKGKKDGVKDSAGNLLDGKRNGKPGSDAAVTYKIASAATVKLTDGDGDAATFTATGGGRIDALSTATKGYRRVQLWLAGGVPLATTVGVAVKTKKKSDNVFVVAELAGLELTENTALLKQSAVVFQRLTFAAAATGL